MTEKSYCHPLRRSGQPVAVKEKDNTISTTVKRVVKMSQPVIGHAIQCCDSAVACFLNSEETEVDSLGRERREPQEANPK